MVVTTTYAIIETGGKQYRVEPGKTISVEKIAAEEGSTIELDRVLLLSEDSNVTLGQPTVEGARVVAEVVEQAKGAKIIVLKFKRKVRYSVKQGHRQRLTRLAIKEIVSGAGTGSPAPRRRRQTRGA